MDIKQSTRDFNLSHKFLNLVAVSMLFISYCCAQSSTEVPLAEQEASEYCQWDKFHPTCPPDHVVEITHAKYGRMLHGRCLKRDYGYRGCDADVRALAARRCSGRPQCEIQVPDQEFEERVNGICPEDFKMSLRATYKCIPVVGVGQASCSGMGPIDLTASNGTLSSYLASRTECGGTGAPWRIHVPKGQKIELTFINFAINNKTSRCTVYAIVKELGIPGKDPETICGGDAASSEPTYISDSSDMSVRIVTGNQIDSRGHFLLKFRGIHCADPDTPDGAWFRKSGDDGEMGCQGSEKTKWRLTCRDGVWEGKRGRCDKPNAGTAGVQDGSFGKSTFTKATSLLIVMGIAVIIGLLILLVGLFILRRRHNRARRPKHPNMPPMMPPVSKQQDLFVGSPRHTIPYNPSHPPLLRRTTSNSPEENEYAYVEEFQFSAPTSCGCTTSGNPAKGENPPGIGPYGFFEDGCPTSPKPTQDCENVCAHGDISTLTSCSRSGRGQVQDPQKPISKDHPQYFTLDPHTVKISDANANVTA